MVTGAHGGAAVPHRAPRPSGGPLVRRLVCVSANAAIDKTVAVDRLLQGAIHRPEMLAVLPGGKALNVARAARHLALPAVVVAVLGGHAGAWIAEELGARGIELRSVAAAGESRTCTSVLDRTTGLLTELYEPGVTLDAACWHALEEAVAAEVARAGAGALAVLSGSLPPGAPEDGYGRLATVARAAGALVALDAAGASLRAALAAGPWLVKVNAAEAGAAMGVDPGGERGAVSAARALREAGAGAAVVTRGVDGAVLATAGGTWRIGPAPERGPYAVGSGDAFLAGLADALARGQALPEAARRGAAVAAAHALVPGQGELDPATADRIVSSIALEPVD